MPYSYHPLSELPKPLDVVWCCFPEEETPGQPGPKVRPVLVRRARMDPDTYKGLIEVAYGSTKLKLGQRPLDLTIQNLEDLAAIGLPHATRFDLDRTIELPWCKEFFKPAKGYQQIKAGRLNDRQKLRLQSIRQRRDKAKKGARRR